MKKIIISLALILISGNTQAYFENLSSTQECRDKTGDVLMVDDPVERLKGLRSLFNEVKTHDSLDCKVGFLKGRNDFKEWLWKENNKQVYTLGDSKLEILKDDFILTSKGYSKTFYRYSTSVSPFNYNLLGDKLCPTGYKLEHYKIAFDRPIETSKLMSREIKNENFLWKSDYTKFPKEAFVNPEYEKEFNRIKNGIDPYFHSYTNSIKQRNDRVSDGLAPKGYDIDRLYHGKQISEPFFVEETIANGLYKDYQDFDNGIFGSTLPIICVK